MSEFSDRVRARYLELLADSQEVVDVPAWGVSFRLAPLTPLHMAAIESEPDVYSQRVRQIVCRAKRENGSALFNEDDFNSIRQYADMGDLLDVMKRISEIDGRDAEKKQ